METVIKKGGCPSKGGAPGGGKGEKEMRAALAIPYSWGPTRRENVSRLKLRLPDEGGNEVHVD